jgi:hypothetical protein
MTKYRAAIILGLLLFVARSAFCADNAVRQIEIKSHWGGLGTPQQTDLVIQHEAGTYKLGRKRIDAASVEALVATVQQPPIGKPSLEGLGITKAWLQEQLTDVPKKSSWWKLKSGTPKQGALFGNSFTDPDFVSKVLPSLFNFSRTDDYPSVEVTVSRDDGSTLTISSHSQYSFMLPWDISANGNTFSTFNSQISAAVAALMPNKAANKERIAGKDFDVELAEAAMKYLETDWNLLGVEDKAESTLAILRTEYTIMSADINPYHDVAFGTKWNKAKSEEENCTPLYSAATFQRISTTP